MVHSQGTGKVTVGRRFLQVVLLTRFFLLLGCQIECRSPSVSKVNSSSQDAEGGGENLE